jgi:hypothetical protein
MNAKTMSLLLLSILMLAVAASPLEAQNRGRTIGSRAGGDEDVPRETTAAAAGDLDQRQSQMFVTAEEKKKIRASGNNRKNKPN